MVIVKLFLMLVVARLALFMISTRFKEASELAFRAILFSLLFRNMENFKAIYNAMDGNIEIQVIMLMFLVGVVYEFIELTSAIINKVMLERMAMKMIEDLQKDSIEKEIEDIERKQKEMKRKGDVDGDTR